MKTEDALRKLVDTRLSEFLQLGDSDQAAAARRLDIGCQFLLNINGMERGCMTAEEWVSTGLSRCRDNYLPHVAKFIIRTDWPNR